MSRSVPPFPKYVSWLPQGHLYLFYMDFKNPYQFTFPSSAESRYDELIRCL